MAYEELVRGPEFVREFNDGNRRSKPAYSFIGVRSQSFGFRDKEVKEVVVGLSLQEGAGSFQIHIIHEPILLVRAWRATQILDELRHVKGASAVTDAYEILDEQTDGRFPKIPFQRLAADFGWYRVAERRQNVPELEIVPEDRMYLVAQYLDAYGFTATLREIQSRFPSAGVLNSMEQAVIDHGLKLDQKELQKARELLSHQVPVMGLG